VRRWAPAPPGAADGDWHGPCFGELVSKRRMAMVDLAYVLGTLVFFAIAWFYAVACERL